MFAISAKMKLQNANLITNLAQKFKLSNYNAKPAGIASMML